MLTRASAAAHATPIWKVQQGHPAGARGGAPTRLQLLCRQAPADVHVQRAHHHTRVPRGGIRWQLGARVNLRSHLGGGSTRHGAGAHGDGRRCHARCRVEACAAACSRLRTVLLCACRIWASAGWRGARPHVPRTHLLCLWDLRQVRDGGQEGRDCHALPRLICPLDLGRQRRPLGICLHAAVALRAVRPTVHGQAWVGWSGAHRSMPRPVRADALAAPACPPAPPTRCGPLGTCRNTWPAGTRQPAAPPVRAIQLARW